MVVILNSALSIHICANFAFRSLVLEASKNNIEMIIDGYKQSESNYPFIVVGPLNTNYARFLTKKYKNEKKIKFMNGIYEKTALDYLRYNCRLYFHGHSVGGTNPSLLEAMSAGTSIAAHDNIFNRSVLGDAAYFFKSSEEVSISILNQDVEVCNNFSDMNISLSTIRGIFTF